MVQNNDTKSSQPNLPEEVRQELFKSATFDAYEEILKSFEIGHAMLGELGAVVLRTLKGGIDLEAFPKEVAEKLSVSQEDANKISIEIFTKVLFPFHGQLQWIDFDQVIRMYGGGEEDVARVVETPEDFVRKYVYDLPGVTDKRAMRRLEVAFLSLVQKEHTEDEIVEQLQRPVKLNGLEITEQNAREIVVEFVHAVNEMGVKVEVKSEVAPDPEPVVEPEPEPEIEPEPEPPAPPASPAAPPKPPTPPTPPSAPPKKPEPEPEVVVDPEPVPEPEPEPKPEPKPVPKKKTEPVRVELAEPIELKKEPPKPAPAPVEKPASKPRIAAFTEEDAKEIEKLKEEKKEVIASAPPSSVEEVVTQICQLDPFKFEDGLLQDRCTKIIESRVRDVRDPHETRRRLELSVDKGGLGVKGRQLADMTEHIEKTVSAYEVQAQDRIHDDKRLKRRVREVVGENKEARVRKKERMMNQRYAAITGKAPTQTVHPVGPRNSRTTGAIAAHVEMQQLESRIDKDKVREVIEKSKAPKSKPSSPAVQPKMVDVVSSKRLAGPTEELSRLSLIDFRRLSKDPVQAMTKIKDKIDLLENRGYELKVAGVKAWRQSPLNMMYMKLAERAVLEGVPLSQVLESARSAGEDTLSDEELKAIMNLNATLRF